MEAHQRYLAVQNGQMTYYEDKIKEIKNTYLNLSFFHRFR